MFLDVRSLVRYLVASPGLVRLVDCQLKRILLISIELFLTLALEFRMKTRAYNKEFTFTTIVCRLIWTRKRQTVF